MTIQHKDIPDAQLHEPKGIVSSAANKVYVANGAGSGTWKQIDSTAIQGLTGDGGVSGKKMVSNGTNGFSLVSDGVFGSMVITGNTNAFAITAAADSTLNTNSDYVLFTGTGAPWAAENLNGGLTFTTNRLTVPVNGVYRIDLWADISGFPTNTASVSVKYRINGTTFSSRHPKVKSNSAGDAGQLNGFGLIPLNAGDFIQLYLASTATGSLTFIDVNTTITLVKAT